MANNLFGVKLPKTKKNNLIKEINLLKKNSKKSLYFLYSEYFIRANRNPFYKSTLNNADFLATDGKGALWSQWKIQEKHLLPSIYAKYILNLPFVFRIPIFLILFLLELVLNIYSGFFALLKKTNWLIKTGNELILGRDFVYELLEIANKNSWKVAIIGGDIENTISQKLKVKFPNSNFFQWSKNSDSNLMMDKITTAKGKDFYTDIPTSQNITSLFPALVDAQNFLEKNPVDLVLVCIGGKSGKQEFFIDNTLKHSNINFRLITGIGAALDHLGAGKKQIVAPKWMINTGLEWVHRFLTQPYRRFRIVDSIFTLWWWTTLQEFTQLTKNRLTAVNVVTNANNEILLAKRYSQLVTGDVGWAWFQGGIEEKVNDENSVEFINSIKETGMRELLEETNLNKNSLKVVYEPVFSGYETTSISLRRFLVLGASFKGQKKYLNFINCNSNNFIKTNWENKEAKWFSIKHVQNFLVPEKLEDWQKAQSII